MKGALTRMSADAPVLHVCAGPTFVLAEADDDRPTRWCFYCRKHLPHRWFLLCDPPECQPSYYEPVPVLRCSRCDRDDTLGFGMAYDGPHYPESDDVCDALLSMARERSRLLLEHSASEEGS